MELLDIPNYRLANQNIFHPASKTPGEIVSLLGAVQAQNYPSALWAIGLRIPSSTKQDVEKAIQQRRIIRTWPMRGTLHFVAAEDVRWMVQLLAPRTISATASRRKMFGLDDELFKRCKKLLAKALEGDNQLTRKDLYKVLEDAKISTKNNRGLHILHQASYEGLICFAAHDDKQPTFALLDEWVPKTKPLSHEEALAELVKRYFTSHGPATVYDLAWWSGLRISEINSGIEMVSKQVSNQTINGKTYWMSKSSKILKDESSEAYLLPDFDEYIVSYKDRSAVLNHQYAKQGINGRTLTTLLSPTIIVDGNVVGTWKRSYIRSSVVVTRHLLQKLDKEQLESVASAAEKYGRFLGMPVVLK